MRKINPYKRQAALWLMVNGAMPREVANELGMDSRTASALARAEGLPDRRWRWRGDRIAKKDRHGQRASYAAGCRCVPCTDANTERLREAKRLRVDRFRRGEIEPPHGVKSTYTNYDCRCDPCREAWSEHMRSDHVREIQRRSVARRQMREATDHVHEFENGRCIDCYEREDAVVVKLDFLRDRTVEAIDLARRTIAQLHEDEANDRMLRAEWDDRDGAA